MNFRIQTLSLLFLFLSISIFSQTNVRGQLELNNTQLIFFNFNGDQEIAPLSAKEYFKPYLAYYDQTNNIYQEGLMDSFLFCDLGFFNDIGYDQEFWDFYLKSLFVKTKLPIIRNESNNSFAVIPELYSSALTYKLDNVDNFNTITLEFDIKALNNSYNSVEDFDDDIVIGIEFFDSDGNELKDTSSFNYLIDTYEWNYVQINEYSNNFQTISQSFSVPNNAESYRINIINWALGQNIKNHLSKLAIDNVKVFGSNAINQITTSDSNFSFFDNLTNWEFNPKLTISGTYLPFKNNRNPLIQELNNAHAEVAMETNLPVTKIILTIPKLNYEKYTSTISRNILKSNLDNFLNQIENYFNNSNYTSNIQISGLYYIEESIKDQAHVEFISDIFSFLKPKIESKGWKLYGSPYQDFYSCDTKTTYADQIVSYFDVMWQQPGAFFKTDRWGEVDRNLLKSANKLMYNKNFNVNVESVVLKEDELYGRVNDYFDFGDKFGYINYAKVYYDNGGAHYINSQSNIDEQRVDYDNLYRFIKKAEAGVITNNRFEIRDEDFNNRLHHWTGNYNIKKNESSTSHFRELSFLTDNNQNTIYSKKIPIKQNDLYKLKYGVKEIINDSESNSALIGVNFYDINGNELTNLNTSESNLQYTSFLNSYYKYTDTNTLYVNDQIYFKAPSNVVSFRFFIRKWRTSNLNWKSFRLSKNNEAENSRLIYRKLNEDSLSVNIENFVGKNSLELSYNEYAVSSDTITILPNQDYTLKLKAREKLPLIDNRVNKALIAIEPFDSNGNKLTNSVNINGFSYTPGIQMYYRYLSTNQEWSNTLKTFQFPSSVSSIRIYLRNWNYNNTVYIDDISFTLNENNNLNRNLNNENLFQRDKWSEKLPLEIEVGETASYNNFINVQNISNLNFRALIRGSGIYPSNRDLVAIEFYDSNYDLLTDNDINSSETNLTYSSYYKYWWLDYLSVPFQTCEEIGVGQNPPWYKDQWEIYERSYDIPSSVSYMKFYFQKVQGDDQLKVLNPQLTIENTSLDPITKNTNHSKRIFNENKLVLYPNPSYNYLKVDHFDKKFSENTNFKVYDINGKTVKEGSLKNNKINTSNLEAGFYIIRISDKKEVFYGKFLKGN